MRDRALGLLVALTVLICGFFSSVPATEARNTAFLDDQVHVLEFSKSVPGQLSYQGFLVDATDSLAVTATLEMTFRLYDSETKGAELWSEIHPTVEVSNGLFQVLLGSITSFPANLFDEPSLWLQTEVGSEILAPRKPLVSVAYSQRAEEADQAASANWATEAQHAIYADTADYTLSAGVWTVDGDNVYRESGRVGIGTASPLTELDVNGSVNAATYYGDGSHLTGIPVSSDGDWTIDGSDMYSALAGNVGIGTPTPSGGKLHVLGSAGHYALMGTGSYGVHGHHATDRFGQLGTASLGVYGYSYTPLKKEVADETKLISYDGVRGECDGVQSTGVLGRHLGTGNIGSLGGLSYGVSGSGDPYAGYFTGNVYVSDSLGIGTLSPQEKLHVSGAIYCADSIYIDGTSSYGMFVGPTTKEGLRLQRAGSLGGSGWTVSGADGIEINKADGAGVFVGRTDHSGIWVYEVGDASGPAGWGPTYNGFEVTRAAGCGLFVGHSDSAGVYINSTSNHGVAVIEPEKSGFYVSTAGGFGVYVDSSDSDGMYVDDSGDDGVHIYSCYDNGVVVSNPGNNGIWVGGATNAGIYVSNAGGDGGYFDLQSSSTGWAVYAHSEADDGNGIYCRGDGIITGAWSKTISTSKGWEAVQTLSAPDEEIVASGMARLVNGRCRVEFERLFSEAISHQVPVKIVLTPLDQWSGLYAAERSHSGFTALTGAGAQDVGFTWQAIGRRKGYEERPVVNIPDPDEENARLAAEARLVQREEESERAKRLSRRAKSQFSPQRERPVQVIPVANER